MAGTIQHHHPAVGRPGRQVGAVDAFLLVWKEPRRAALPKPTREQVKAGARVSGPGQGLIQQALCLGPADQDPLSSSNDFLLLSDKHGPTLPWHHSHSGARLEQRGEQGGPED